MGTRKGNNESWIRETPDAGGYYEAFVSMGTKPNGKPDRRHVKRTSLKAVRKRVRELENARDAGRVTAAGRKIPTVEEMMERHLTVVLPGRRRAPRTIADYWSKCRNDIFPRWGGQRIDRVLPEHIEDGIAEMTAAGRAPSHIRKVLAILSSAYDIQVERENVGRNPCSSVDAPELDEPEIPVLTEDEALAILAAARERPNAVRWVLGLALGLRQGEALGLGWEHLDAATGNLDIWRQLQRLTWEHGCADGDDQLKVLRDPGQRKARRELLEHACALRNCKTKPCPDKCKHHSRSCPRPCPANCTGHARACKTRKLPAGCVPVAGALVLRPVKEKRRKSSPLVQEFLDLLRVHYEAQVLAAAEAGKDWEDYGLIFCQWNGRPIDPRRDWAQWGEILKASGLSPRRLHSLRHSAATFLIGQGVALPVVQQILGHSDIRVTQRYIKVADHQKRDASQKMAAALLGPRSSVTATKSDTAGDQE
jgi:integrase